MLRNMKIVFLLIALIFFQNKTVFSQRIIADSADIKTVAKISGKKNRTDTAKKKEHSPRIATIRSAIFPGLGQIYNKKYWKLPIVYGAMGGAAGVFLFNFGNYKATRFAYKVKYNMRVLKTDSAKFNKIRADLIPLSEESLRFYRNQFRRDIDYSAIFFLVMWGLNIVDATVDAHLKSFDVSPDLSLKIKPGYSDLAKTNGLSLIFTFK